MIDGGQYPPTPRYVANQFGKSEKRKSAAQRCWTKVFLRLGISPASQKTSTPRSPYFYHRPRPLSPLEPDPRCFGGQRVCAMLRLAGEVITLSLLGGQDSRIVLGGVLVVATVPLAETVLSEGVKNVPAVSL